MMQMLILIRRNSILNDLPSAFQRRMNVLLSISFRFQLDLAIALVRVCEGNRIIMKCFNVGQRFAGLEERVVFSTLFRRFTFRSTQTIDELQLTGDVILRSQVPIQMFIERR